MHRLTLSLLTERLAICRLEGDAPVPDWALVGSFASVTRSPDELSVVCPLRNVPPGVRCEPGWRGLRVQGPLDFSLVGVMAALAAPLASAGVSMFALSTYDTDYLLVRATDVDAAVAALEAVGHTVRLAGA